MNDDGGAAGTPALVLKGVSKAFRVGERRIQALDEVSLSVARGQVTGLIGPDGAGKTTLMRLAVGLLRPDAGTLRALGMDTVKESLRVQGSVGYMPQRFGLYEDLTVGENLDLYADLQGLPVDERPERYRSLMRLTGLAPFIGRLARRLSGGMQQKLGLACTLVRPPRLLLLDEPTVGVDPVSRRELWSIVYHQVEREGMTVLLSTAYLDEAERCREVLLLHEGRLLDQGPPGMFSARMEGRTYAASVPGMATRRLQQRLSGAEGVRDAIIQGDHVRLVMAQDAPAEAGRLLPGQEGLALEPVAPRFEDGFVTLLGAGGKGGHAAALEVTQRPRREADIPVIKVHELRRRFGDFLAVRGVSFDVAQGEVFGLLGANGAGKTTTFRMLCGLLPASGGTLRVAGVDLRTAPATARGRIGYMSQHFSLYSHLTVLQNLQFFASAYGLGRRRRSDRLDWAIEQFELAGVTDSGSADLPLGYKQRLAMACALMHEPDILFLDEPTSGVDPLARREFWRRINALAEQGVTVMVTTHFMEEAEYCDRVAIMVDGAIPALGTPAEIKHAARTEENPEPGMEDAFIALISGFQAA
jgi:ABC-2 type transport system ATP-binding protein